MIKHIYFVRHGETEMNKRRIHQGPDEPLNENGRKEAEQVGKFLEKFKIDTLLSSPFVRARETAEIIGKQLNLPHTPMESVKEFRRPRSQQGKSYYSFGSFMYLWNFFVHKQDPNYNNENAENMFDIRNRVHDVKFRLAKVEGECVVVVSHTIFMNAFVELICNEIDLSLYQLLRVVYKAHTTKNTGIFHIIHDKDAVDKTCEWSLVERIYTEK